MKTVLIVVAVLSLCACGQKNSPAPTAAAQKPKAKETSGTITLDQTEQQKGHIARRRCYDKGGRGERDRAGQPNRQRGEDLERGGGRERQG